MRNNFNQMRFWLATIVVASHSYALLGFAEPNSWGMTGGGMAVICFFIISGYLITQSWNRSPSIPTFASSRALRLLPGFIASVAISYYLSFKTNGYDVNPLHMPNGTWWTLSWEVMCYFAVLSLGFIGALNRTSFPAILGSGWVLYFYGWQGGSPTQFMIGTLFMVFGMGMFIALNEERLKIPAIALWSTVLLIPFLVEPLRTWLFEGLREIPFYWGFGAADVTIRQTAIMMTVPFIVIYLGGFAKPIPFWKADMSYGIYLYGWPIGQLLVFLARRRGVVIGHPAILFAATMALAIPLSLLSWHFLEHPAIKLKRIFKGRNKNMPSRASA